MVLLSPTVALRLLPEIDSAPLASLVTVPVPLVVTQLPFETSCWLLPETTAVELFCNTTVSPEPTKVTLTPDLIYTVVLSQFTVPDLSTVIDVPATRADCAACVAQLLFDVLVTLVMLLVEMLVDMMVILIILFELFICYIHRLGLATGADGFSTNHVLPVYDCLTLGVRSLLRLRLFGSADQSDLIRRRF